MREIKFRAWDKSLNKFLSLEELDISKSLGWAKTQNAFEIKIKNFMGFPEDTILMQYTGLKDKNGKEIYEGDIAKYEYEIGKHCVADVYFEERTGLHRISCQVSETMAINHILGLIESNRTIEIIGNIYENPELLTTNTQ